MWKPLNIVPPFEDPLHRAVEADAFAVSGGGVPFLSPRTQNSPAIAPFESRGWLCITSGPEYILV